MWTILKYYCNILKAITSYWVNFCCKLLRNFCTGSAIWRFFQFINFEEFPPKKFFNIDHLIFIVDNHRHLFVRDFARKKILYKVCIRWCSLMVVSSSLFLSRCLPLSHHLICNRCIIVYVVCQLIEEENSHDRVQLVFKDTYWV